MSANIFINYENLLIALLALTTVCVVLNFMLEPFRIVTLFNLLCVVFYFNPYLITTFISADLFNYAFSIYRIDATNESGLVDFAGIIIGMYVVSVLYSLSRSFRLVSNALILSADKKNISTTHPTDTFHAFKTASRNKNFEYTYYLILSISLSWVLFESIRLGDLTALIALATALGYDAFVRKAFIFMIPIIMLVYMIKKRIPPAGFYLLITLSLLLAFGSGQRKELLTIVMLLMPYYLTITRATKKTIWVMFILSFCVAIAFWYVRDLRILALRGDLAAFALRDSRTIFEVIFGSAASGPASLLLIMENLPSLGVTRRDILTNPFLISIPSFLYPGKPPNIDTLLQFNITPWTSPSVFIINEFVFLFRQFAAPAFMVFTFFLSRFEKIKRSVFGLFVYFSIYSLTFTFFKNGLQTGIPNLVLILCMGWFVHILLSVVWVKKRNVN